MAREKYTIIKSDYLYASDWITRRFDDKKLTSGEVAYKRIAVYDCSKLQEWTERYLTADQLKKMKISIRASRSRKSGIGDPLKNITLNSDAWLILSTISKCDNVTLSSVITKYLASHYSDALENLEQRGEL